MMNIMGLNLLAAFAFSAAVAIKWNCNAPQMPQNLYVYRAGPALRKVPSVYKSGQWVFLRCKGNNYLVGNAIRRCQNGSWTGTVPRCIARREPGKKCKRIRIRNGRVKGSRRSVNAILRFKCYRGYNLMGSRKLICLSTGKWNRPVPKCLKDVNCPNPGTPVNGFRLGSVFKNGRTVAFSCKKGYKLIGSASRKCKRTGKWGGKPAKCVKIDPLQELKEVADNLRKNMVNRYSLVTSDSRARAGISSGASGLDIVFVLDSSASVGKKNFQRGIEFVQTIIKEFGVSTKPHGTRVAIVTFHSVAEVKFNFKTNRMKNKDEAKKKLANIQFQGGGTNTEAALDKVYHVVATETRKNSEKVLFLITDGRSNAGTNPGRVAASLRRKDFQIYTIGITKNADKKELRTIASQPYRSHVYLLADYKTLEKLKNMVVSGGNDSWDCGFAGDTALRGSFKTPDRKASRDDAWPWQAAIYVDEPFKCGGALITDEWVLTAASCFDKKKINDLSTYNVKVILGEQNRLEEEGIEQTYSAVKIIRSKRNSKKQRDDLALVKLKTKIKQTAYVHSVCYDENPKSSLIWPTQYGVVTGWGSKNRGKSHPTIPANDKLQQALVKFASERECRKAYTKNFKGNVFCGSSEDSSVANCLGDTGGPVVVRGQDDIWTLVGIMKLNEGCSKSMKYSLFTKVGHYAKWITETMFAN